MECSSLDHCQRANMTFDIDRGRVLVTNPWNDSENHSGQVMDIHRVAEDSRCMNMVRLVNDRTVGSTPSLCMVRVEGGWMDYVRSRGAKYRKSLGASPGKANSFIEDSDGQEGCSSVIGDLMCVPKTK